MKSQPIPVTGERSLEHVLRALSVSSGASAHIASVGLFYAAYRDESFVVLGHVIMGGW